MINLAGMTALHQAVLDDNLNIVEVLVAHGAKVNIVDVDSWTPLHAAAANGFHDIVKYLLKNGADKNILTDDGETALDLVEEDDFKTKAVLLDNKVEKIQKKVSDSKDQKEKLEPAWFRKISVQEEKEKKEKLKKEKDDKVDASKNAKESDKSDKNITAEKPKLQTFPELIVDTTNKERLL